MKTILFSFGTHEQEFTTLANAALAVANEVNFQVIIQAGYTKIASTKPNIEVHRIIDHRSFNRLVEQSDVFISQVSPGNLFTALENGHIPIMWPRRKHFLEHVDDHQFLFGDYLSSLGLAQIVMNQEELLRAIEQYRNLDREAVKKRANKLLTASKNRTLIFNKNLRGFLDQNFENITDV